MKTDKQILLDLGYDKKTVDSMTDIECRDEVCEVAYNI